MKKTIIFLSLMLVAGMPAAAETFSSYFAMGEGDTVKVSAVPGETVTVPVRAHFDNRFDKWNLTMTYPEGLDSVWAAGGEDMNVPYLDSQGREAVFQAVLLTSQDCGVISASTNAVSGYWDMTGTGGYVCYGSVKWEVGDYGHMFDLMLRVGSGFKGGTIAVSGLLSAGPDVRDWSNGYSMMFYKTFVVVVSRTVGDVNGDGEVDINDVTVLIAGVLDGSVSSLSGDDLAAADVTGNGEVDINDITALISIVLNGR